MFRLKIDIMMSGEAVRPWGAVIVVVTTLVVLAAALYMLLHVLP